MDLRASIGGGPRLKDVEQHILNSAAAWVRVVMQPVEHDGNACGPRHLKHLVCVEQAIVILHDQAPPYGVGQRVGRGNEPVHGEPLGVAVQPTDMNHDFASGVRTQCIEQLRVIDELGDRRADDRFVRRIEHRVLARMSGEPDLLCSQTRSDIGEGLRILLPSERC